MCPLYFKLANKAFIMYYYLQENQNNNHMFNYNYKLLKHIIKYSYKMHQHFILV